jgi:hypothetical protein
VLRAALVSKEEKQCPSHLLPIKYDDSTYKLSVILPSSSKTELTDDMIVSTSGKEYDAAPAAAFNTGNKLFPKSLIFPSLGSPALDI